MKFYVELKGIMIKKIYEVPENSPIKKNKTKTRGIIVEDDEFEPDSERSSIFCVVNIERSGDDVSLVAFSDKDKAEDYFQQVAFRKFSNWDEYSSDEIQATLDDGYAWNGDGSLWICEVQINLHKL